jgi:hypothetical protein
MTPHYTPEYLIGAAVCIVVGVTSYQVGYAHAQEIYQQNTKYRCHEEVVYKWTGSYWDKLGQPCKTEAQMKGMT